MIWRRRRRLFSVPLPRPSRSERVLGWMAARLDIWKLRVALAERFARLEKHGRERLARGIHRVRSSSPLRRSA